MMRFYFGHHKCATAYLEHSILRPVCRRMGLKRAQLFSPEQFSGRLDQYVRTNGLDLVSYINADQTFVDQLDMPFRAVPVIRDPRDIVVSAYFSHLHAHLLSDWAELPDFRKKLSSLSEKEGLLAELDFISDLTTNGRNLRPLQCMMDWNYDDPRILELRFEDMVSDPEVFFRRFGRQLRLSGNRASSFLSRLKRRMWGTPRELDDREFLGLVDENSFAKLAGRPRGVENRAHHYRKGQPGDWRNYFDDDITRAFKSRFPGLVSRLGYEANEGW